jgi:predicted enzyme related to lactoylglutathione lyase
MNNQFVWVDIPVTDLDRAIAFYSKVLDSPVSKEGGGGFVFGLLPHSDSAVSGCLYKPDTDNSPSKTGPLVYLNATGRLKQAVQAVAESGGKVLEDIHQIGPYGFRAIFIDSEGNRMALHAPTN